jgi:hypothetical protein
MCFDVREPRPLIKTPERTEKSFFGVKKKWKN